MVTLGVPYTEYEIASAQKSMDAQADLIAKNLTQDPSFVESYNMAKEDAKKTGKEFVPIQEREIVALIAYLQRLGTDIKTK